MDFRSHELLHLINDGHFLAKALQVVAQLGVADAVGDEPVPVTTVAQRVGAKAEPLARVLRLLASRGIFTLEGGLAEGTVSHTAPSRLLASDHPHSFRPFALNTATTRSWRLPEHMLHMVRTGEPAVAGSWWNELETDPEEARLFDAAMVAKSHTQIAGVIEAFDFSRFGRVVDVGGGRGHLLSAILDANPGVRGVLFDRPEVVEAAKAGGHHPRMEFVGGSFFEEVPPGDATLLMEVLHDWNDEDTVRILRTIRRAAAPESRLLVIEADVGEGDGPTWGKLIDIIMMTIFAGRQRARAEFARLFEAAGYTLTEAIPTGDGSMVFTGVPA